MSSTKKEITLLKEDKEIVIGESLDFFLKDFLSKENPRFEFNVEDNFICKIVFIKIDYNKEATIAFVLKRTFNINLN